MFVSTKACTACAAKNKTDWARENPTKVLAQGKNWRVRNPAKFKAQKRAHYLAHQALYFAAAKRRKLDVKQRTPAWADLKAIAAFYVEARARRVAGDNVEVDHIIPLNGEFVSGLHIHTNLQIIPAKDNRAKSNSFSEQELSHGL